MLQIRRMISLLTMSRRSLSQRRTTICDAFLLGAALLAGCATSSSVQSRRQERAAAYNALSPELRALVDQGQIRVGMNEDAVYMAWGKPSQVLRSGDGSGEVTTWLYTDTSYDTYQHWRYQEYPRHDGTTYLDRSLNVDYSFQDYVSAELQFQNGALTSWRMLPRPMERTIVSPGP
jgi:outer membrane protein assembly factor BamE (lipoprotein component of BamABCDE complex)